MALLFGYAWSWVMAALGLVVRTPEAVQAAAYMGVFPLAFTSSVFVPVQTIARLAAGVRRQPAGHRGHQRAARADPRLRRPCRPADRHRPGAAALAWSAAIIAVFAPLAVRLYRRPSS